ncbi:MAG: hypothetical protein H7Z21_05385, partial [Hymenobacter sp.]|nr:hypothetical protein [Hymenobacter sp.]
MNYAASRSYAPTSGKTDTPATLVAWPAVPPAAGLLLSVIIPARDEAENLPATLAALAAQTTLRGQPLDPASYEILVLANNCRDQTAAV